MPLGDILEEITHPLLLPQTNHQDNQVDLINKLLLPFWFVKA